MTKKPTEQATHAAAIGVHLLTATGVVWALLATVAITRHQWTEMFLWLGVALIVDAIDGPLARKLDIKNRLPNWDGAVLDLVVDYLTYVFVPAYVAIEAGIFPNGLGLLGGSIICLSSICFFGFRHQKTDDNYFFGFPAVWNLFVFYAFVFQFNTWAALVFAAVLAALTFAPVTFVHPVRVVRLRVLTMIMLLAWTLAAMASLYQNLDPEFIVKLVLAITAIYFLAIGFVRAFQGETA